MGRSPAFLVSVLQVPPSTGLLFQHFHFYSCWEANFRILYLLVCVSGHIETSGVIFLLSFGCVAGAEDATGRNRDEISRASPNRVVLVLRSCARGARRLFTSGTFESTSELPSWPQLAPQSANIHLFLALRVCLVQEGFGPNDWLCSDGRTLSWIFLHARSWHAA